MAKKLGGISADLGLLILRVGIGVIFIIHGWPKIKGGPEMWENLGGAMEVFGITFLPHFWGFMVALSEFVGGILIVLGAFTRVFSLLLFITMVVAANTHLAKGEGFSGAEYAIALGIIMLSLFFIGSGRFSFSFIIRRKKPKEKPKPKE